MGNVILGLLLLGPATLYSLTKQFQQGISLFYSASLGSLRAAASGLLARGLVTVVESVENGRSRKTYTITDTGQAAFISWMTAPITGGHLETVALSKLYFVGMLAEPSSRATVLENIVDRIRDEQHQLQSLAAHLDSGEVAPEHEEIYRFRRITLEYGLVSLRTALEFFESVARAHEESPSAGTV